MTRVLGFDFGGTKLAAGVVDLEAQTLRDVKRIANPGTASASCEALITLARTLRHIDKIERIGVCFGGPVFENTILRSVQVPGWENFPLENALTDAFGGLPVKIANDCDAIALGEWHFGAGRGANSMMYVTVSTGIGSGIILNGQLLQGETRNAGEIGHCVALPGGALCPCGKRGCLEAVAAGPAIAREAAERLARNPDLPSDMRGQGTLTAADVARYARDGDTLAREVLQEAAGYVGTAIATAANLMDFNRVVVGGGVSRSGELWWRAMKDAAQQALVIWRDPLELRPSGLDGNEGVWGAAALVL